MVEDIQELVKNKNVLFVGNSVEIMHHKLKDTINSYDIVVRFGRAIQATPAQEESIGTKVDIWVTGQFRAPCYDTKREWFERGKFKDVKILLNRCRGNFCLSDWIIEDRLPIGMPYTQMYTDQEIIDIMNMFDVDMLNPRSYRPSAGFLTILWFMQKVNTYKSLNLIGFDFFAKKVDNVLSKDKRGVKSNAAPHSWHLPVYLLTRSAHDAELEQQFMYFLKRRGDINWHILSDLKDNQISYNDWMKGEKLTKTAPRKSKVSKILPRAQRLAQSQKLSG
mgnify:FL=1